MIQPMYITRTNCARPLHVHVSHAHYMYHQSFRYALHVQLIIHTAYRPAIVHAVT